MVRVEHPDEIKDPPAWVIDALRRHGYHPASEWLEAGWRGYVYAARSWNGTSPFGAWAYRNVGSHARAAWMTERRRRRHQVALPEWTDPAVTEHGYHLAEIRADVERWATKANLTARQAEACEFFAIHESPPESLIVDALGITSGAARSSQQWACTKLRHVATTGTEWVGGWRRGESARTTKLTTDIVRDCRRRHTEERATFVALAREYGVDPKTIRSAVLGLSWGAL